VVLLQRHGRNDQHQQRQTNASKNLQHNAGLPLVLIQRITLQRCCNGHNGTLYSPHQFLPPLIHLVNNPTPDFPSIGQLRITDTLGGPSQIEKTGYSGFLWFFSVAENIFSGGIDGPGNLNGHFLKNFPGVEIKPQKPP
jgi:hypothetical protein